MQGLWNGQGFARPSFPQPLSTFFAPRAQFRLYLSFHAICWYGHQSFGQAFSSYGRTQLNRSDALNLGSGSFVPCRSYMPGIRAGRILGPASHEFGNLRSSSYHIYTHSHTHTHPLAALQFFFSFLFLVPCFLLSCLYLRRANVRRCVIDASRRSHYVRGTKGCTNKNQSPVVSQSFLSLAISRHRTWLPLDPPSSRFD